MPENKVNLRIAELAAKWRAQQLTPEEKNELDEWYTRFDDTLLETDSVESVQQLEDRLYAALLERAGLVQSEPELFTSIPEAAEPSFAEGYPDPTRRLWPRYAVAAAAILILASTWLLVKQKMAIPVAQVSTHDVAPGGNKAILTLASGQQIVLSDVQNGKLAQEQNATIEKTADGSIRYIRGNTTLTSPNIMSAGGDASPVSGNSSGNNPAASATGGNPSPTASGSNTDHHLPSTAAAIAINTITTPRGGQYAVTLSDGTKVVLDASSSIKYPAVFTGKSRSVEITGEAWFDVAPDKQHPFHVITKKQDLEVLGTEFNINSYDDEPGTKTTLLAGSVKISDNASHRSGILKPGQQSNLTDQTLSFTQTDTEEAIAWKNGYFMFNSEDISSIMRKVARWYDVDVVYAGPKPTDQFNGTVQRLVNVSQVLKKLELTKKVHFTIEGRTITVSK